MPTERVLTIHALPRRVSWVLMIGLVTASPGWADDPSEDIEAQRAVRASAIHDREANLYSFRIDGETPAERLEETVLKWSNPADGSIYGSVFLWTVDARPVVSASLYQWYSPHTHRSHELVSMTDRHVRGDYEGHTVWDVEKPGIEWRLLTDIPPPSASASVRLAQMRRIVSQFSCQKTDRQGLSNPLRLLRQPVYRYESPSADVVDGALFTFVQGTDPEVWILLEARSGKDGELTWQFAATRNEQCAVRTLERRRRILARRYAPVGDGQIAEGPVHDVSDFGDGVGGRPSALPLPWSISADPKSLQV